MTNDTGLVTRLQQMRFFLAKPDGIEIYIARSGTERAGYLLLRHDKTTTLITEAVEPFSRRLGIAAAMVRYAQERHSDLTAEIRSGNLPSIALHRQAGFSFVTANGEIQTYRFCR